MTPEQLQKMKADVKAAQDAKALADAATQEEKDLIAEAKALGLDVSEFEKKPLGSTAEKKAEEQRKVEEKSETTSITPEDLKTAIAEATTAAVKAATEAAKPAEVEEEKGGI